MVLSILCLIFSDKKRKPFLFILNSNHTAWVMGSILLSHVPEVSLPPTERAGLVTYIRPLQALMG